MATYLKFYSLNKHPFDVRPGKGPVLATRPVRHALAWVREQLEQDQLISCVSGAAGVGRTALARVMPASLAEGNLVARVIDPTPPWKQVEEVIAKQLCLMDLSRDSLLDARALGQRIVLIVDAAERASSELLEQLDALMALRGPAAERLVQIVLLARAEHEAAPGCPLWPWLAVRCAVSHELEPIPPDEIHRYIRRRLQTAGRVRDSLFTEAAALVVHRESRGVPRHINQVCDTVLQEALRRCKRRIDGSLVVEAMCSA